MKPMIPRLIACLWLAASAGAAAADTAPAGADPFEAALAQARERRVPVLVDFTAPWCYSCYYMAKNVLTGPEWERATREAVAIELDADSPVGTKWKEAWGVKAMPTYLLFNAQGQELGRVLGEQTRADFYAWLSGTRGRDSLEAVKARVKDGSKASLEAAREVLRAYHARYDADGGLAWLDAQPEPVTSEVMRDSRASSWVARLELMRAESAGDAAGCAKAAPHVFAGPLACELPYELSRVMDCTGKMPEGQRRALLASQAAPMQRLLDRRVLSAASKAGRCADERSIVLGAADLQQALGNAAAEKGALDRAIEDLKARIGGDLRKDRNMSDNLRVYLERAGRIAELDQMFPLLTAAYPDDYVYPYRHAKSLASRGQHAEAAPLYEQAAAKTYGVNKLHIAELRAQSLKALGRTGDARQVLADALQANGPWFPDDAAKLKALLDSLPAPAAVPAGGSGS
jgi:thioredoxin-like negative regulator of GroEL